VKLFFAAFFFLPALAPALFAHGVEAALLAGRGPFPAQAVSFSYSTGEVMSFAVIKVFAPSAPGIETMQSITDRNGVFSFTPDEAGEWRITAEDGMGHKGEITVLAGGEESPAGAAQTTAALSGKKPPLPLAAALGVSLICNIFACWYFAGTRRKGKSHAH
jgi:hypothetical protein